LIGRNARRIDRRLLTVGLAMAMLSGPLVGCSNPVRLAAVPKDQQAAAVVDGLTGIRYWQKEDLPLMEQDGLDAYKREVELFSAADNKGPLPPANYLAVSGGGENGDFGGRMDLNARAADRRQDAKLLRPQHGAGYYAAFIRDPDGNRIEAVTFLQSQADD